MAEKDINLKQVDQPVFANLTEGIEWVFQNTQERDYVIKAGEGKVYIYHEDEITPPEPEPIKTFNLYGEYE